MKPIRVFILRDRTTALFIAAYYKQEKMSEENFRDICIILCAKYWGNYIEKFIDGCQKIARIISSEMIICPDRDDEYIPMAFLNRRQDNLEKIEYLKAVKELLGKNNININLIREVYHGHGAFHQYIKYLNPKIKLINFEHGTSDIKGYLLKYNLINRLKYNIKYILGKIFFIFYQYAQNDDLIASLFADEISKVNKKDRIRQINGKYIKEIAYNIASGDIYNKSFLDKENRIGVVLLSSSYEFMKDKEGILKLYIDFAKYSSEVFKNFAPNVNTIIFKPRAYDRYFSAVKNDFIHYFKDYKVIFFDEISKVNYPVEFYLDIIRPEVIFGDISSGLFYSKALMPKIEIYSFHEYIIASQLQNFGFVHPDYEWLVDIFYRKYSNIFKAVLPYNIRLESLSSELR